MPLGTYISKKGMDHEELTRFVSETGAEMKPDDVQEGEREGRVCLHVVGATRGPLSAGDTCGKPRMVWGGGTVPAKSLGQEGASCAGEADRPGYWEFKGGHLITWLRCPHACRTPGLDTWLRLWVLLGDPR